MLSGAGWTEDWTLGGALGPVALVVLGACAIKGAVHDGWLRAGRSAADVPTWLQVLALLTMAWASIDAFGTQLVVSTGEATPTEVLGESLLGRFVIPFEVVSFVLLAALIGGITIARRDLTPVEEEQRAGV